MSIVILLISTFLTLWLIVWVLEKVFAKLGISIKPSLSKRIWTFTKKSFRVVWKILWKLVKLFWKKVIWGLLIFVWSQVVVRLSVLAWRRKGTVAVSVLILLACWFAFNGFQKVSKEISTSNWHLPKLGLPSWCHMPKFEWNSSGSEKSKNKLETPETPAPVVVKPVPQVEKPTPKPSQTAKVASSKKMKVNYPDAKATSAVPTTTVRSLDPYAPADWEPKVKMFRDRGGFFITPPNVAVWNMRMRQWNFPFEEFARAHPSEASAIARRHAGESTVFFNYDLIVRKYGRVAVVR